MTINQIIKGVEKTNKNRREYITNKEIKVIRECRMLIVQGSKSIKIATVTRITRKR